MQTLNLEPASAVIFTASAQYLCMDYCLLFFFIYQ